MLSLAFLHWFARSRDVRGSSGNEGGGGGGGGGGVGGGGARDGGGGLRCCCRASCGGASASRGHSRGHDLFLADPLRAWLVSGAPGWRRWYVVAAATWFVGFVLKDLAYPLVEHLAYGKRLVSASVLMNLLVVVANYPPTVVGILVCFLKVRPTALRCSALCYHLTFAFDDAMLRLIALHSIAVHCSPLHSIAFHCIALQSIAVHCSPL